MGSEITTSPSKRGAREAIGVPSPSANASTSVALARALAARAQAAKKPGDEAADTGDALLALGEHESFALSVEGARLFARGNTQGVPERLELAVSLDEDGAYAVHASGFFESAEATERAKAYWQSMADRFAAHPLVALIGMREPLTAMKLSTTDSQLSLTTRVSVQQARVLLGFLRQALDRTPRGAPAPVPVTPVQPTHDLARPVPRERKPLSPPGP